MCSGGGRQILAGLVLLAAVAARSSLAVAMTGDGDAELLDGGSSTTSGVGGGEKKAEAFYDGGGYGSGYADYGGGYGGHHPDTGLVRTQGWTESAC